MKRSTRMAPKASCLYARVRRILDRNTKLLVVAKGHALRDEFGEAPTTASAMNRNSKTTLLMEGGQLAAPQTPPEILDAPGQISDALARKSMSAAPGSVLPRIRHAARGESWYPGYGMPGATRERASHGG